jgi:hypothetical protein
MFCHWEHDRILAIKSTKNRPVVQGMVAKKLLTLSTIEYILIAWANSVDPDQLAHSDLHCLLLDSSGYF